jgi:hypothetical protein
MPSDLIAHYSSHAFHTRIYALTFSGAVLGAVLTSSTLQRELDLIGLALIVVVASLGELNRRYTHSYLAASRASGLVTAPPVEDDPTRIRWEYFRRINEHPWAAGQKSLLKSTYRAITRKYKPGESLYQFSFRTIPKKFLLAWSTYLPGLLAGLLIVWRARFSFLGKVGIGFGIAVLVWWLILAGQELDGDKLKSLEPRPNI